MIGHSKLFLKKLTSSSTWRVQLQLTPIKYAKKSFLALGLHLHPLHPWLRLCEFYNRMSWFETAAHCVHALTIKQSPRDTLTLTAACITERVHWWCFCTAAMISMFSLPRKKLLRRHTSASSEFGDSAKSWSGFWYVSATLTLVSFGLLWVELRFVFPWV